MIYEKRHSIFIQIHSCFQSKFTRTEFTSKCQLHLGTSWIPLGAVWPCWRVIFPAQPEFNCLFVELETRRDESNSCWGICFPAWRIMHNYEAAQRRLRMWMRQAKSALPTAVRVIKSCRQQLFHGCPRDFLFLISYILWNATSGRAKELGSVKPWQVGAK